jgi:hypothetical protein
MNYTVIWKPSAEQELALIWINASNRRAITAAANRIDTLLRVDPLTQGESRTGGTRVLFQPPLAVLIEVKEEDRLVAVLKVWRIPTSP